MDEEALTTDSFASMLGGEGDNEQTEQSDSQSDEPEQENSEEAAPEGTDEGEQEGADEEADEEQAEQPEKDSDEPFLELEINGEKVKLSKDEAKNGYLRQQDYTQKAQRLATERQDWNNHVARQAQEVTQFAQEIGTLTNLDATLGEYAKVDWAALRTSDPMTYSVHMTDYNAMKAQRAELVAGIGQKQQQLKSAAAEAQKQTMAQQTQEAAAHMATIVPGFGKEHIATIREFGQKAGFTDAELANVADKRMIEVLWKASQFDKSQASTKQAIKAVSALPTKANKPAASTKPAAQLNIEKQVKRVQQTGSVKDFAAMLAMTS